ncbi:hypothetical protein E2A64_06280 [Pseudohoeflea suaedae]|uniref:DUF4440 domain-containing protein n=1 Tax=Pseudohoeflea suaedae TaxID=877384 RepID=A0A4R5PPV1_9HYPH|nr:hypothetical protein [Pseudohoeflea suaedae]TDH38701.1 hypothetical protein E2A64_06280 [Pseudohoeflea suaedae]
MTSKTDFWDLEKHFWTDGPGFYRDNMSRNAIMVFPAPVGLLSGQEIIDGIDDAPGWDDIEFEDRRKLEHGKFTVLSYRAGGRRTDGDSYSALCSTSYYKEGGRWKLFSHQQAVA